MWKNYSWSFLDVVEWIIKISKISKELFRSNAIIHLTNLTKPTKVKDLSVGQNTNQAVQHI